MPDGTPDKVKEIADAIKRDNPDIDDETKFKMAWAQYKKMGKGKDAAGIGGGYGSPSDIGATGMIYDSSDLTVIPPLRFCGGSIECNFFLL